MTKATVFQSYILTDGREGCMNSHIGVAKVAKALHPTSHYLVFEDDCVLDKDWEVTLNGMEFADVVYLGYNDKCEHTVFGCHALYLSPKARDCIIDHAREIGRELKPKWAMDWILSRLCRTYGLITCMPKMENREKWCHQQKGLVSQITGRIRV
jgi:GR25 family glycosyltransferase involved in LPS biosynthesis